MMTRWQKFVNDIANVNWDMIACTTDPNESYNQLTTFQ